MRKEINSAVDQMLDGKMDYNSFCEWVEKNCSENEREGLLRLIYKKVYEEK